MLNLAQANEETPLSQLASRVINYVLDNFAEDITLDDLAQAAELSRYNFCRRFQKECGISPMRWLWTFRTMLAAEFITLDPHWSLTDVAFSCGFSSSAHFSRSFKQIFQLNPSAYRKKVARPKPSDQSAAAGPKFDDLFSANTNLILKTAKLALTAI